MMGTTTPTGAGKAREIFISTVQFEDELKSGKRTVLDLAPLAATFGVQGVEYRDVHWKDKVRELPAVRSQLAQLRLKATYTTVTALCHKDPAAQNQLLQDIEDTRALGALLLRVNLGEWPGSGTGAGAIHSAARGALERASSLGIHLSLENNSRPPDHLLADIEKALRVFNCRFLGTNIDFGNYVTTDQDPIAAIRTLTSWIDYTHAKDAWKAADGWKSTYLGNGTLPLKAIIAALDATDKPIPFCFEFPGGSDPDGAITKSLEFMAKLGG